MPTRSEVVIWISGPGKLPADLSRALDSQGIATRIHFGAEAPPEAADVVVRWCDSFASSEFATAIEMLASKSVRGVVVVTDGVPALPPEALRSGLLLVDRGASPKALATSIATALVSARELGAQEQERIRLNDVADAQENLVAVASHDLRTPVSTLKLVQDLLRSGLSRAKLPPGSQKIDIDELLSIFERNLQKMEIFIDDILEASRLYRGRTEVRVEPVALNTVVDDTVAGLFPVALKKDIVLDFVRQKNLPDIRGEHTRIGQVVTNLVGNALKYTPAGGSVTVYTRAADGGAQLEVADTGPGIPEADHGKIFKRFSCGSARATGGEPSTGLGLFICREIVDLYGGKIWFESTPGSGCRFFVSLPKASTVATDVQPART
jgi:signal transduction histidine kinase